MKKILIVDRSVPDVGGVRTYVKNLTQLLQDKGFIVDNYKTVHNGSFLDKYLIQGLRLISNKIYRPYGIIVDNYLFSSLINFILPKDYDYYIFQQPILIKKQWKNKIICIIHSMATDNLQGYQLNKQALNLSLNFEKKLLSQNFELNYTVSSAYSKHLKNKYDLHQKISYINNFLIEDFYVCKWEERDIDMIYTGQFNERKNIFYILETVRTYNEKFNDKLNVFLLGNGLLTPKINEYIQKYNLSSQIKVILSPERNNLKKLLSQSKVLILSSYQETFSYSLLEAKLSGCVTLATHNLDVPKGFIDFPIQLNELKDTVNILSKILADDFDKSQVQKNFENPLMIASNKFQEILK